MADLNDFKNKNTKFTGTSGQRISTGSTAERVNETARLRFNSTSNLMEYYTGTEWKAVDAPPTITSFNVDGGSQTTSTFVDRTLSGNAIFVILGSLFSAGATVSFIGQSASITASTVTVDTANQITALIPHSSFLGAQEPYGIRVTNLSGLFATLESCLSVDARPVFNTASGSLGTIGASSRSSYTLSSAAATDVDGDTITYSITSGSLPAGLSLNSSTAAITGTASSVVSNTTSTFTVSAATTNQTSTRQFSITVNAPVVQSFTSTGAFTFNVPSGITNVDVLVVAGGGGGGYSIPNSAPGGGGGAGGLIFRPAFPVTPGGTVSGGVGGGGGDNSTGQDSTFGSLTSKGGGGGKGWNATPGDAGGSGGGGGSGNIAGPGPGTQPGQPGDSGTFGFGNPGGSSESYSNGGNPRGGGGGGAGAAGLPGPQNGQGGVGRAYSISGSPVFYSGGGGGGAIGGGAGQGGAGNGGNQSQGQNGTANRGGGGGGSGVNQGSPSFPGSSGGSGIVIVQY